MDFTTSRIAEVFDEGAVMPLYRLTFAGQDGSTSECEVEATNLPVAFQSPADISQLIKIERLNRIASEVMGGRYSE